jgi:hypothetical protein
MKNFNVTVKNVLAVAVLFNENININKNIKIKLQYFSGRKESPLLYSEIVKTPFNFIRLSL